MKKLSIIFIALITITITGCSTPEWLSESEIFARKTQCAQLTDSILSRENMKMVVETTSDEFEDKLKMLRWPFFSTKLNTCFYGIYSESLIYDSADHTTLYIADHTTLYIMDAIENKTLWIGYDNEMHDEYLNKIEERKTE